MAPASYAPPIRHRSERVFIAMVGSSILHDVIGGVIVAAIVAIAGAVGKTYKKHQQNTRSTQSISQFLFDTEEDPVTHVPARKGWTTKIEDRLRKGGL